MEDSQKYKRVGKVQKELRSEENRISVGEGGAGYCIGREKS